MHFLTMSHWITMSRARSPPVRIEESVSDNAYTPLRIRRSRYSRVRHRCIWVRHVYLPFSFAMPRAAFSSVGKLPFIHRMHTEKEREYIKYMSQLCCTREHIHSLFLFLKFESKRGQARRCIQCLLLNVCTLNHVRDVLSSTSTRPSSLLRFLCTHSSSSSFSSSSTSSPFRLPPSFTTSPSSSSSSSPLVSFSFPPHLASPHSPFICVSSSSSSFFFVPLLHHRDDDKRNSCAITNRTLITDLLAFE